MVADAANRQCVFLDDNQNLEHVIGSVEQLSQIQSEDDLVVVAIGDNGKRMDILDGIAKAATVIHPSAVISTTATLGEGTVVFANAVVNPFAIIGRGCIINTAATVDHDCIIGDGVHISPGAHLGGGVSVERCSWIGIGASVKHGVSIGENVVVGAGAAVVGDIPDNVTIVGVPAKETVQ